MRLSQIRLQSESILTRIQRKNQQTNAFTSILTPSQLADTLAITATSGSLAGTTIGVKDVFCTKILPTTAASKMLQAYTSPFDATVVRRIREAGGVIMGKTNMDEFGMGSANLHSQFGPVVNPISTASNRYVAGGSSGGSAAAVADNLCTIALASDTGGSTRLPAAYCGVIGLKPSYGLISRWGMIAYASSLDCVGIMAKTTDDVRRTFNVISAFDEKDPTSIPQSTRDRAIVQYKDWSAKNLTATSKTDLTGLRIGVPLEYFPTELSPTQLPPLRLILSQLVAMGATLTSISLPSTPNALGAYYVIASAEASSNLARFDGTRFGHRSTIDISRKCTTTTSPLLYAASRTEGFGSEVMKRILLGTYALSAGQFDNYFLEAQRVRLAIRAEFDQVFRQRNPLSASLAPSPPTLTTPAGSSQEQVDIIIHPSSISTAPPFPSVSSSVDAASVDSYVQDILNVPSSLAGLPAMSIPVPLHLLPTSTSTITDENEVSLPVGVQIVAQWGGEDLIFRVSEALEEFAKRV